MFTAALFIIVKTGKQPHCPPAGEWIKKMWPVHPVAYYSAMEKKMMSTDCRTT